MPPRSRREAAHVTPPSPTSPPGPDALPRAPRRRRSGRRAALAGAAALLTALPLAARAALFTVTSEASDGEGSLREAIEQANATPTTGSPHRIGFDPGVDRIELADSSLPLISRDVEIDGEDAPGLVISGDARLPIFFVESGSVVFRNLTLEEGVSRGGDGADRGGGGLGAGGALFVDAAAVVTLENVDFDLNTAQGGDAGTGAAPGGGGGGFHGDGGAGAGGGGGFGGDGGTDGGGGGGSVSNGEDGSGSLGGDGGSDLESEDDDPPVGGGAAGGSGSGTPGADGEANEGGGGSRGGTAGNGGLGGGGGGSTGAVAGNGGNFGGGGGTTAGSGTAGNGGFGGGGGGANSSGTAGEGGFGAGDGSDDAGVPGQGGSGLGGAVFVRTGGVLRIVDGRFGGPAGANTVVAGMGEPDEDTVAEGADLYLMPDVVLTFEVSEGELAAVGASASASSIAGEGRLVKTGDGSLRLFGANQYEGGTEIQEGQLIGEARSLQGEIDVRSEATLRVEQSGGDGVMAADLAGTGTFQKAGADVVTLEGTSRFSGRTEVLAGRLAVTPGALTGAVALAAGSEIEFAQDGNGSFASAISGDGRLLKTGAATLTLTGANSYTGGTVVEEGALAAAAASLPGDVSVAAAGELRFVQGSAGTFDGDVSGDGRVTKRGGSRLTATGSWAQTGGTEVEAGELALDGGVLAAGVDVDPGAALAGQGTVGGLLRVRGTLVGDAPAALSVGDVSLEPGSVLAVTLDPASPGGARVVAAGDASLDGVAVDYATTGGFGAAEVVFPLLSAAGALTASDLSLAADKIFLDEVLEVTDLGATRELRLRIARNGETVASIAATPNQQAVAAALLADEAELGDVLAGFEDLTRPQALGALDALSGESLGSLPQVLHAGSQQFARRIAGRMGSRRVAAPRSAPAVQYEPPTWIQGDELAYWRPPAPVDDPERVSAEGPLLAFGPAHGDSGWGGWLDGYGIVGDVDGGNAAGSHAADLTHYGTAFGVDYQLREGWLAGVAASVARSETDLSALGAEATAETYRFALYGAHASPSFWVGALAGFGWTPVESERRVAFGGVDERASAEYAVREWTAYAEAGYGGLSLWGTTVEPMVALAWGRLDQEAFDEEGGGSVALRVEGQAIDSLAPLVGLQVERAFAIEAFESNFVPELHLRYARELLDVERRVEARLAAPAAGDAFAIEGSQLGRDQLVVGTSYVVNTAEALSLSLGYDFLWNESQQAHRFTLGGLLRW